MAARDLSGRHGARSKGQGHGDLPLRPSRNTRVVKRSLEAPRNGRVGGPALDCLPRTPIRRLDCTLREVFLRVPHLPHLAHSRNARQSRNCVKEDLEGPFSCARAAQRRRRTSRSCDVKWSGRGRLRLAARQPAAVCSTLCPKLLSPDFHHEHNGKFGQQGGRRAYRHASCARAASGLFGGTLAPSRPPPLPPPMPRPCRKLHRRRRRRRPSPPLPPNPLI